MCRGLGLLEFPGCGRCIRHLGLQEFLAPASGGSLLLGSRGFRPQTQDPWGEEGRFLFEELPSGTGSLRVWLRNCPLDPAPLFMLDGLPIGPGGRVEDPRLQEIDLRGRIHRFEVTVLDTHGKRLEEGAILMADGRRTLTGPREGLPEGPGAERPPGRGPRCWGAGGGADWECD